VFCMSSFKDYNLWERNCLQFSVISALIICWVCDTFPVIESWSWTFFTFQTLHSNFWKWTDFGNLQLGFTLSLYYWTDSRDVLMYWRWSLRLFIIVDMKLLASESESRWNGVFCSPLSSKVEPTVAQQTKAHSLYFICLTFVTTLANTCSDQICLILGSQLCYTILASKY
jgi:hypothetical protein